MADKLFELEARHEHSDYSTYRDAIEHERQARAGRGEYLSPKDAYTMVRARDLPRLLEEERKKALDSAKTQQSESQQVSGELSPEQKAGPAAAKKSTVTTREDFLKLPTEEKEKFLEDMKF